MGHTLSDIREPGDVSSRKVPLVKEPGKRWQLAAIVDDERQAEGIKAEHEEPSIGASWWFVF